MLFSQAKYFNITKQIQMTESDVTKGLSQKLFKTIEKTQKSTSGFVNPYSQGSNNPVYSANGAFVICLRTDSKSVPASVVKRKTDIKVREQESQSGVKISKADKDEIKEQIISSMIASFPIDFIKTKYVYGIIYLKESLFVIDTSSDSDAEMINTLLRRVLGVFPVLEMESPSSPGAVMTSWLQDDANIPEEIEVQHECKLVDEADDKGPVVVCRKQDLFAEEVIAHIDAGKEVSMLQVLWNDSLEFKINSDLTISGIKLTDLMKEQLKEDTGDGGMAKKFDAEVAIVVNNMRMLAPYIIETFS